MKKSALFKSSIREILRSPARFFSILGIIFLGVAFFVGLRATGPDMLRSADDYYKKFSLADTTVFSSLGFSEQDLTYLMEQEAIEEVSGQYMADIYLTDKNQVVRFFSYKENQLNQPQVEAGRLPEKEDEIVLDSILQDSFKLNDTFEILEKDDVNQQLQSHTFKIVGFVTSPEFIDNTKRGNTNVGNGSIDYFALIPEETFEADAYTRLLIQFQNLKNLRAYSDEYEEHLEKNQLALEELLEPRSTARLSEIKEQANQEITENQQKITDGEKELADAEKKLTDAKKKLDEGASELADSKSVFTEKIAAAEAEIQNQEQQLTDSESELISQEQQLNQSQREVDRQAGMLAAREEQLTELSAQRAALNDTLSQLAESEATYLELKQVINSLDQLSEQELASTLSQIQDLLRLLLIQLPDESVNTEQIETILTELTPENITNLVQAITILGETIQTQRAALENNLQQLDAGIAEINAGKAQLTAAQDQIDQGRDQINTGKAQIAEGKTKLAEAKQTLALEKEQGQSQLNDAEAEWQAAKETYETSLATFTEKKEQELPKLKEAQATLDEEQEKINELAPATFTLSDREANQGYTEYKENANRITSIATVFPTIFFLIAALVTLTTMGRMIEEKRVEIGTLKALGYNNQEIAQKFMIYSLSAGLSGSVLGLALGFYLFPTIIISAYGQLYNIKEFVTPWYLGYSLTAIFVALVCTVGISLVALRVDLRSNAASLLRPKAPKIGKRILLEHLTPIWKRLSFIQKVTMRNLFRYKSRMLMTIFGIAGCTAMILTGFGLRDSISDIVPIQFSKIWVYQGLVTFNEEENAEDAQAYSKKVEALDGFSKGLRISSETLSIEKKGQTAQDVTVYVPEEIDSLPEFVLFNDRTSGKIDRLTDEGAIISEKLAKLFQLEVGDTMTLKNADNQSFDIKISAIVENYVGHFAYLSPNYFNKVFDKQPVFNSELLLFDKTLTKSQERQIAEQLMQEDNVVNVSFLSDSSTALDETTQTLNIVVWVLIISAGLLALIVLYNLNNINVSERIRELSTIKVLGFYDKEVTMYIYRENIFLTIIGIGVGLIFGLVLHSYVLQTVELDMIMFSPEVHLASYLYASLITVFFTIIVGVVMFFKLKTVDMIEALKSNE